VCHVIDAESDEITAAQLAIDRKVEHRKIARAPLQLQLGADGPDVARRKGGFGPRLVASAHGRFWHFCFVQADKS
jgi:hypothetical protein